MRSWLVVCAGAVVSAALAGCSGNDAQVSHTCADSPAGSASANACALGRGVNFGNMFDAPEEGDWNVHYDPAFVPLVKSAGFSHIRLPVRWSNHAALTADATLDEDFATRIDGVIDLALSNGLSVVLDAHHYRQLDGDPVDPGEMEVDPSVLEDRLVNIWSQLAARYRDRSTSLLFELYNEPHGALVSDKWNALAARALAAVRAVDTAHSVLIGPSQWDEAGGLASLELPADPNLVLTIHSYLPYSFTLQGTTTSGSNAWIGTACCSEFQAAQIRTALELGAAFGHEHGLPVYLGEWGSSNLADDASRVNYARSVRSEAESRGITWAVWSLIDMGIYSLDHKSFYPDLLKALVE